MVKSRMGLELVDRGQWGHWPFSIVVRQCVFREMLSGILLILW